MISSLQGNKNISGLERSKKPKLLVVDDEQDNLDLLYRTFRRDFQVFKAESGIQALEILEQEGEVAVIISDQRMPEMKGTEFLSKTVPQFPDTVRIVLTGFTDVEDLVEAINSGQVYKYITKPWDPEELKTVVQKATQTYDLLKQRSEELRRAQAQNALLATILQIAQQFKTLEECLQPIANAFGENFGVDGCILQLVEQNALIASRGTYDTANSLPATWLENDPLTQQAIASQALQICLDTKIDPNLANSNHYNDVEMQSHLVTTISYRNEVLAILSLQWQRVHTLQSDDASLIQQCADEVGLALACIRQYQIK